MACRKVEQNERHELRPRWNDGPFEALNGFQTPPVNWTINSPFKRAFFSRVAEITGASMR